MSGWADYLTNDEIHRLIQIKQDRAEGRAEARRIYDRCRKRMAKAKSL